MRSVSFGIIDSGSHQERVFLQDAAAARKDYVELKTHLEALFDDLRCHFSGNVSQSLTKVMANISGYVMFKLWLN